MFSVSAVVNLACDDLTTAGTEGTEGHREQIKSGHYPITDDDDQFTLTRHMLVALGFLLL